MSPDLLVMIRDIAIIVMAVMVTVAAVVLAFLALKTYPKIRRAASNFELASCLMLDSAVRISGLITAGNEIAAFVRNLVGRFGGRGGGETAPEEQGAP